MHGVSTYIAAIFMLFILVAFMTSVIIAIRGWGRVVSTAIQMESMIARASEEKLVINNATVSGSSIVVGVSNEGSYGVLIKRYYVRDLINNEIYTGDLNKYIPPSTSTYVIINGSFTEGRQYLVVLITSSGEVSRVYKVKCPYTPAPPATGVPNVTYSVSRIPLINNNYTVATLGYNSTVEGPAPPSGFQVVTGEVYFGSLSSLSRIDGNQLVIRARYGETVKFPEYGSWKYYREINITEETGVADLVNYTVKMVLTNSNFNFSNAKSDGSDVIFLASDGSTPLPFWIEKWDSNAGEAVVWVKIPRIPRGGTVTIYMLYDNPNYNNRDKPFYGLTKVMTKVPANDGSNYRIQYEVWYMPSSLFLPNEGRAMGWRGDDRRWTLTLPFSFPYYSRTYGRVYVCSNGFIGTTYSGTDWSSTVNEFKRRGMISAFWADLRTDVDGSTYNIYVNTSYRDSFGTGVYIRWHTRFYSNYGDQNFAVVLYSNGLIRFDYGRSYGTSSTDSSLVIGISYGDSAHYTLVASAARASSWSNHVSLMFWPRKVASREPSVSVGNEKRNLSRNYLVSIVFSWSNIVPASINALLINMSPTVSNYYLTIAENSSGSWITRYSITNYVPSVVNVNWYFSKGVVGIRINVSSSFSFNLSIDYIAVKYRVINTNDPLILIAINGSRYAYVLKVVSNSWIKLDLGSTLINPAITFSYGLTKFLLASGRDVLIYDPLNNNVSKASITLNESTKDSAFLLSISGYLIYAPGGYSSNAYIINPSTWTQLGTTSLPEPVRPFTCVAEDFGGHNVYVMFGGSGDVYLINLTESNLVFSKLSLNPASPTAYPVGMAYGDGYLWVISRGGVISKINLVTGSVSSLKIQPPYYPMSEGDRLVFVKLGTSKRLYHIRADGTSDLWVINVS